MTIRNIGSERELKKALDTYAADVMVFNFHAPWCGACAQAEPLYHELATDSERPRRGQSTRARRNSPAARLFSVNVEANKRIAAMFNVTRMPTFYLVHQHNVVGKLEGATHGLWKLRAAIKKALLQAKRTQ